MNFVHRYLLMKLREYESGRSVPLTQIGKKRSGRAAGGSRSSQAKQARLKKQKDRARAKASSAIAAVTTATLERLHRGIS